MIRWMTASVSGSTDEVASSSSKTWQFRTSARMRATGGQYSDTSVLTELSLASTKVAPFVQYHRIELELVPEALGSTRVDVDEVDESVDVFVRVDILGINVLAGQGQPNTEYPWRDLPDRPGKEKGVLWNDPETTPHLRPSAMYKGLCLSSQHPARQF